MSERANSAISSANDAAVSTPCATLAGRTSAASSPLPLRTNAMPATSDRHASAAAIHRSARPSSAIIALSRPPRTLRHCERSEAIQERPCTTLDCLAALAMTAKAPPSSPRRRFHILGHLAHLRRHIALVMLGEDAVGDEHAIGAHPAEIGRAHV